MNTAKLALYEFFGYLLPGVITLISIIIIFCILNNGQICIPGSLIFYAMFILISYFLGHVNQSIGNLIPKKWQNSIFLQHNDEIEKAKRVSKMNKSLSNEILIPKLLSITSTDILSKNYIETYIEKEAFYRGSVVGFAILCIVLIVSLFLKDLQFHINEYIIQLNFQSKLFLVLLDTLIIVLFWKRHKRYFKYKVLAILNSIINKNHKTS
jgi:hypothetical protein